MALAYFITFTTYGTWLHGSSKGLGSVDTEHNVFGTPFLEPDAEREQKARETMAQPPYVMGPAERQIVCKAVLELSRDRGWGLTCGACAQQSRACRHIRRAGSGALDERPEKQGVAGFIVGRLWRFQTPALDKARQHASFIS